MTDQERGTQIRLMAAHPSPLASAGQKVLAADIDVLLRLLDESRKERDEARADIARLLTEQRRLRDAIVSARWRLAKGRALWNGPCLECDAALERGLTGSDVRARASKMELAALDAPPEADVMELAWRHTGFSHPPPKIPAFDSQWQEAKALARAFAAYGEQREAAQRMEFLKVLVAAKAEREAYGDQRAREARAAAIEALPFKITPELIGALAHHQRQLDEDGVEVGVSRQACDESAAILRALSGDPSQPEGDR